MIIVIIVIICSKGVCESFVGTHAAACRKATNGVGTDGVTAKCVYLLTEVVLGYQSVKI